MGDRRAGDKATRVLARTLVVVAIAVGVVLGGAAWRESREPSSPTVAVTKPSGAPRTVEPSATPDETARLPWMDGRLFMAALTASTGAEWRPGRVAGTMAADGANGATVYVLASLDDVAAVVVEEGGGIPGGGSFEAVLGVVDPESVPWLERAYAELAPVAEPDGYGVSLDIAGGQVSVSHRVRDGASSWRLSLTGSDWAPPEPSEAPLH